MTLSTLPGLTPGNTPRHTSCPALNQAHAAFIGAMVSGKGWGGRRFMMV